MPRVLAPPRPARGREARWRASAVEPRDANAIQELLDACAAYFELTDGERPAPDAARDLLADVEADASRRAWVLFTTGQDGRAAGLLDVQLDHPVPRTAHVSLLLIRPGLRGQGLGREVIAALEEALAAARYDALALSVVDENAEARAFWEAAGFAEAGRLDRGVTVYEKRIEPSI